jgi:hypothetical protein
MKDFIHRGTAQIKKTRRYLSIPAGKKTLIVLTVVFTALAVIEYMAFKEKGWVSLLASRIWFAYLILFFVLSAKVSFETVISDIKEKNWISFVTLLYMLSLVFRDCGNINVVNINYEAAQQVAAGLDAFLAPDFQYTELGFLGYPMRQYIILAIPSVLLGRSPFALHFAFDVLMGFGVLLMYSGLRRVFKDIIKVPAVFSSLPLLAVFTSPYIQNFIRVREQVIIPPALMLMAAGWLILLFADFSFEAIICSAFAAGFLGSSYTPGLAGAAYCVYVILFIMFSSGFHPLLNMIKPAADASGGLTRKSRAAACVICQNMVLLSALLYIMTTTCLTIKALSYNSLQMEGANISFIISMLKQVATETPYGLFKYMTPFLLLFGFLAMLGCFSSFEIIAFLWSISTVVMGFLTGGYGLGNVNPLSLQRSMVVIPVILPLFFIVFFNYLFKFRLKVKAFPAKTIGFVIYALVFMLSASYIVHPWIVPYSVAYNGVNGKITTHVALEISVLTKEFHHTTPVVLYYTDSIWDKNVYDTALYTAPGVPVYATETGRITQEINTENGLIIFAKGAAEIPAVFVEKYGRPTVYSIKAGNDNILRRRRFGAWIE